MGCTYSEEVDVTGMKLMPLVPTLLNLDDPAIIAAPLPVDAPLDHLRLELCVELHPVTWYGAWAQGMYTCQTSVQGSVLAHLELFPDRSSYIVFPISTWSVDSFPLMFNFLDGTPPKIASLCIDLPAFSGDQVELKLELTRDICESRPQFDVDTEAEGAAWNGKADSVGRVALSVLFKAHRDKAEGISPRKAGQRITLRTADPNDSSISSDVPKADSAPRSPALDKRLPLHSMMAGIRQATAMSTATSAPDSLAPADFLRDAAVKLSLDHGALEMKVFAPRVFSSIRSLDGIRVEEYQEEWNLPEEKLVLDFGCGRSGSLFLRSNSNRFILKTIPHTEVCTFLSLIEGYYYHLVTQPDSFIMHVHGLHRFWWSATWLYVILFDNVLFSHVPRPVHVFDLKGRVAKPGKLMQRRNEKGIVWKDKDLERFFFLPKASSDRYRAQLAADVLFLDSKNMMDYSLLVGVREMVDRYRPQDGPPRRSFFRSYMGGTPGAEPCREVYYIGIIDCLTQYNSRKRVANFCKTFIWSTDTLSTVPSKDYSERFLRFMYAIFPTEAETQSTSLRHPNLRAPIAPLDTLVLNPNQVAGQLSNVRSSATDISAQDASTASIDSPRIVITCVELAT